MYVLLQGLRHLLHGAKDFIHETLSPELGRIVDVQSKNVGMSDGIVVNHDYTSCNLKHKGPWRSPLPPSQHCRLAERFKVCPCQRTCCDCKLDYSWSTGTSRRLPLCARENECILAHLLQFHLKPTVTAAAISARRDREKGKIRDLPASDILKHVENEVDSNVAASIYPNYSPKDVKPRRKQLTGVSSLVSSKEHSYVDSFDALTQTEPDITEEHLSLLANEWDQYDSFDMSPHW